jgi:hypothetical protein
MKFDNKLKWINLIRYRFIKFPKDVRMYDVHYTVNDWSVNKTVGTYTRLNIKFKDETIATVSTRLDDLKFERIAIEEGFEDLYPAIAKVLQYAAQYGQTYRKKEIERRHAIAKQASAQTKFLGPF